MQGKTSYRLIIWCRFWNIYLIYIYMSSRVLHKKSTKKRATDGKYFFVYKPCYKLNCVTYSTIHDLNSYVKAWTPNILGDRTSKEVIKARRGYKSEILLGLVFCKKKKKEKKLEIPTPSRLSCTCMRTHTFCLERKDAVRRQPAPSSVQRAFTRIWLCWHPDLRFSISRSMKKLTSVV